MKNEYSKAVRINTTINAGTLAAYKHCGPAWGTLSDIIQSAVEDWIVKQTGGPRPPKPRVQFKFEEFHETISWLGMLPSALAIYEHIDGLICRLTRACSDPSPDALDEILESCGTIEAFGKLYEIAGYLWSTDLSSMDTAATAYTARKLRELIAEYQRQRPDEII